jgi:uncharacterized protein (TIRG00374 family)
MRRKQTWIGIAKITFSIVVIGFVFRKVDPSLVWNCVCEAQPGPFFLGVFLGLVTVCIAGWRWHHLLKIFQINVPLKSLVCIAQIGQFFSMFLPGPTGDDLTRMLYISRLTKGRVGEACTSVLIDRIIGLSSVLLVALVCIPQHLHLLIRSRQTYWLGLAIMSAGTLVCLAALLFFLVSKNQQERWVRNWLPRFPARKLHGKIERIWALLCANKKSLGSVLAAAIGTQLIICEFFFLAGYAVGIQVSPWIWFGFVPIVLAANAVPVTIAGLGVREYLVVLFLGVSAEVDEERALAASFLVFAMLLLVSLLGGVVYFFFRPQSNCEPSAVR